ncbi:MAG: phenylalanine--tRNA ligase subunit beta [Acidobacteria bacterium]|nr:phenylalanine--tRNA ligase subunit beta [Acidobacteriota bacterium]
MKLSPQWLRDFVPLTVEDRQLADDLTSAGITVEGVSGPGESAVFEMEITTNRPDAMNHYGVAREASAIYDLPLATIAPKLPAALPAAPFPIQIDEPQLCPRFTARVIRNVSVKASPEEIVQRLALLDQRAINNAVDATNYVLWETGKPTHVYDLDLIEGGKLIIRKAREGEKLKTLDGVERTLSSSDLVVADAVKAVGLAGVMGGYDTMITEKTRNVLIESAWWDPVVVRRMSRRHVLHTDASHRFERGADFESTVPSCNRVAEMILASGGGELHGHAVDVIVHKLDLAPVALRMSEVHRFLGDKPETGEAVRILKKLGFDLLPEPGEDAEFTVHIPSWRMDVEREIDLIEEIARLYGYNQFPNTLPAFSGAVTESPEAAKDAKLRASLLALGYNETVSLSFISHDDAETCCDKPVIELANPLSEEASIMRTSVVPGMLNMLAYNLNRGLDNVRLFEAGAVWHLAGDKAAEIKHVCFGSTGSAVEPGVHQAARPLSFFDLKGDVETLLAAFEHKTLHFDAQAADYYHPGRSARVLLDGAPVGQFGQLHPDVAAKRKLKQDVWIAEIYLDALYAHGLRQVRYEPLPKYPAVERDFSFVFADTVVFEKISQAVSNLDLAEMRSFTPAEIFRGGKLGEGKYSILLRAKFQSSERTLREEEVAQWSAQIMKALEGLGGTLRG